MKISLLDGCVEREAVIADVMNVDYRDTSSFIAALGKRTPFDSGILPPGLLSYRQAGEHTQIVIQSPPSVNLICWGEHESDAGAENYTLAQPWRIAIAETNKGALLGARIFYSPVPITRPDQPLYHQNLPNINCRGYNHTGVGWVCLYHKIDWTQMNLAQRCESLGLRVSGNEAYNNANMSETDGPRFYEAQYTANLKKKAKDFAFLWDPHQWEKKSQNEGVEWTLDPELWLPVLVTAKDNQDAHDPKGIPLTFDMAINGQAQYYYQDTKIKDFHAFARTDLDTPDVTKWAVAAFVEATHTPPPIVQTDGKVLPDFGGNAEMLPTIGEASSVLTPIYGETVHITVKKEEFAHVFQGEPVDPQPWDTPDET